MKLITRKRSEQDLEGLARRAYDVADDAAGPAAKALAAANSPAAADLAATAVGTVLVVPEVDKVATRDAAEGPARLAGDQALALRRALAEVRAAREREAVAEAARAVELVRFIDAGGVNVRPPTFAGANFVQRWRDLAVGRIGFAEQLAGVTDTTLDPLAAEVAALLDRVGESKPRPLRLRRFSLTGAAASRPETRLVVPEGFKLLGGGARVNGGDNLLTASHPEDARTWVARSKDHVGVSPASITVTVIALEDPDDAYEVQIRELTGAVSQHPAASVVVADGFVMTGGGARVNFSGEGNLLTASFPADHRTWIATSKDHVRQDFCTITAFAIGLRSRRGDVLRTTIRIHSGVSSTRPTAESRLPPGFVLVGGGARDNFQEPGNLLVASIPGEGDRWTAAGQLVTHVSPATVTAHAIGLADAVLVVDPPPEPVIGDPPSPPGDPPTNG
jgi:hypothetical protein